MKKLQALCLEEPKYEHFRSDLEELTELRNVLVYEYKQDFELVRNGLISTLREVPA